MIPIKGGTISPDTAYALRWLAAVLARDRVIYRGRLPHPSQAGCIPVSWKGLLLEARLVWQAGLWWSVDAGDSVAQEAERLCGPDLPDLLALEQADGSLAMPVPRPLALETTLHVWVPLVFWTNGQVAALGLEQALDLACHLDANPEAREYSARALHLLSLGGLGKPVP